LSRTYNEKRRASRIFMCMFEFFCTHLVWCNDGATGLPGARRGVRDKGQGCGLKFLAAAVPRAGGRGDGPISESAARPGFTDSESVPCGTCLKPVDTKRDMQGQGGKGAAANSYTLQHR
jgi:hypothetical protein